MSTREVWSEMFGLTCENVHFSYSPVKPRLESNDEKIFTLCVVHTIICRLSHECDMRYSYNHRIEWEQSNWHDWQVSNYYRIISSLWLLSCYLLYLIYRLCCNGILFSSFTFSTFRRRRRRRCCCRLTKSTSTNQYTSYNTQKITRIWSTCHRLIQNLKENYNVSIAL